MTTTQSPTDARTPIVTVVGLVGGEVFGGAAIEAIETADVIIGSSRHRASLSRAMRDAEHIELTADLDAVDGVIADAAASGRSVCVLASGDPGFFGIVRHLAARTDDVDLRVHPAPSSVSLAFARAGISWDDSLVVSAHGRPIGPAVAAIGRHPKVAVLTGPTTPPSALGAALVDAGMGDLDVVIASRLGEDDEDLTTTDAAGLARSDAPAMSVVLCLGGGHAASAEVVRFGRDPEEFDHRGGMITKSEVRSVVLGRLELVRAGTLWDLGAGSGSVGIEAATLVPDLHVVAVDRDPDAVAYVSTNALAHGVADRVRVIEGNVPDVLIDLPTPDRIFVGGGGLDAVDAAWSSLQPGGVLVATFASIERALAARELLEEMITIRVERARPIGTVGTRFVPEQPVHVCWGRR